MKKIISAEERKQSISIVLNILRDTLIQTESSMGICDGKLIFFGTDDYINAGTINTIDKFAVDIEDLVK